MRRVAIFAFILASSVSLAACAETAPPQQAGFGPNPSLPAPDSDLIPTVNIAPAKGWPEGTMPDAAPGFAVNAFATNLDHPRWLYALPNGDVLVAETDAPPKPEDGKGIKGFFMKKTMKKAGSNTGSANRISLLRDADGDGVAETKTAFLQGLNSPFGMALVGSELYVAATDALLRFPYRDGQTRIEANAQLVTELPGGPLNHHWTKNVVASSDGAQLYVTVGSNSNVAENGMAVEDGRAAIWQVDRKTGAKRLYATGLRNPNGLDFEPESGALWTVVNERDELGDNLVPDYLTSVKDGGFYGWPYSYWGQHVDERVEPQKPELVAKVIVPDYALGAHTAPLGLAFYDGSRFADRYHGGAFIGQHGSWNREPKSGYKVVFVPFAGGKPSGMPEDVLTGFLDGEENALGRPVGVAIDMQGNLLIADDVGNSVWRVTPRAGSGKHTK